MENLAANEFNRGRRVGVMLPDGELNLIVHTVLACLGSVLTTIDNNVDHEQFSRVMDYTKLETLMWMPDTFHEEIFLELQKTISEFQKYPAMEYRPGRWSCTRFPHLHKIFSCDEYPFTELGLVRLVDYLGKIPYRDATKVISTLQPSDQVLMYTRLTEDGPRGRMYTHSDVLATANHVGELLQLGVGDRITLSVPLQNEMCYAIGLWAPLIHGCYVTIPGYNWNPEEQLKYSHEEHSSIIIASPWAMGEIISHESFGKYNLSRIKKVLLVSETPAPQRLIEALKAKNWTVFTMSPREKANGTNFVPPVRTRMGFVD